MLIREYQVLQALLLIVGNLVARGHEALQNSAGLSWLVAGKLIRKISSFRSS
jgi:hypothetical protein